MGTWWVPASVTEPFSSTAIRSARRTVDNLCHREVIACVVSFRFRRWRLFAILLLGDRIEVLERS